MGLMLNKKPRALILAFRNLYLNNSDDVLYEAIQQVFDVVFYGPGYVPLEKLISDPLKIYDELGPFDACFIHQYVTHNLHSFPGAIRAPTDGQYFYFDKNYFCDQFSQFATGYNQIPCPKFLISLRSDVYAFTEKEAEEYSNFKGHILMPPSDCIPPLSEQLNIADEQFALKSTDRFIKFSKKNQHKLIPLAHLVSSNEFVSLPPSYKKYTISVPGVLYSERKNAYNKLKEAGYSPRNTIRVDTILRSLSYRLRIPFHRYVWGIKYSQFMFKHLISRSQVTFTDGSRVRIPVRKYFEIPAFGSLLAAEPFYNADSLGFIDGENFVKCDSKTITDVVEKSLSDPEWSLKITHNAQKFIKEKHSAEAWSLNIRNIFDKVVKSDFYGAKWSKGTLTINSKKNENL